MPVGVRDPGYLPNVLARVEAARRLLRKSDLDESTRVIIEGVLALATTQHELNKRLWEGSKGFAEPHADTHKGADDSVSGVGIPEPIEAGDVGALGSPGGGYAPLDHEHPVPTGTPVDLGNALAEGSSLSLPRLDHVHKILARGKLNGGDVAIRNALDFRDTTFLVWTITDDPGNDELDIAVGLSATATIIWRGGTLLNPTGAATVDVGRLPYAATVTNVRGKQVAGTPPGTTINAQKNGSLTHLAADHNISAAGVWEDGGAVQNTAYAAGDYMQLMVTGLSTPKPSAVSVQVDLVRT